MDDYFQLLIYLVFFAIYGISQFLKNRRKNDRPTIDPNQEGEVREQDRPENRPVQPKTFDDVIRELMGDHPAKRPRPQQVPQQEVKRRARQAQRQSQESIENEAYETGSKKYQRAVNEAKKVEKLDERIDLQNLDKVIKPIKELPVDESLRKKKEFINDIRNSLKSPESARKAIILSEILNKKYF